MADETLHVQTGTLRREADELGGTALRLGHGLTGAPGLVVDAPDWSAGRTLAALETAMHTWLGSVGARAAATGGALRACAEGYDSADDRAALRFVRTR